MYEPLNDCFDLKTRRLARASAQIYDQALKPLGLKNTQFSVLYGIHVAQAKDLPMHAIADALGMQQSSLTRAVMPFVRDGLATLHSGKDRRQKAVHLTPKGDELLALALPAWRAAQEKTSTLIGELAFNQGRHILTDLRNAILEKHPKPKEELL